MKKALLIIAILVLAGIAYVGGTIFFHWYSHSAHGPEKAFCCQTFSEVGGYYYFWSDDADCGQPANVIRLESSSSATEKKLCR